MDPSEEHLWYEGLTSFDTIPCSEVTEPLASGREATAREAGRAGLTLLSKRFGFHASHQRSVPSALVPRTLRALYHVQKQTERD